MDRLKVATCLHVIVFSYSALNGWYVLLRLKLLNVDNRIEFIFLWLVVSECLVMYYFRCRSV